MKTLFLSIAASICAAPAFAFPVQNCKPDPNQQGGVICKVPEISAMEGTAALAAIAAIVLITWERRRRAAA